MRENLFTAGVIVGASVIVPITSVAQKSDKEVQKPNVVFIMSDQHNANALSCYGNKEISTPNLDRLAKSGVLFTHAYCQTGQSVPSRYSIFTGRYARSTGTYSNGCGQNPDENTVADLFKKAGYVTATIGKHHMEMGPENQNHGFDVVETPVGGHVAVNPLPMDEVSPGRSNVGESNAPNEQHTCGLTAARSIKFIQDNKDKPFVLWCSFVGPHTPIVPSAPWSRQYKPEDLTLPVNHTAIDHDMPGVDGLIRKSGKFSNEMYHKQTLAYYYGLVSQIDYNIGLVLDELKKLGLDKNTIVIYSADHGEMMSEHGAWTKGSTAYEATIRVPYIVSYPNVFEGGKTCDELVCSIDVLPTLLDVAGLDIPANIQGKSLVPLVENKAPEWREYIFTELGANPKSGVVGVRSKDFKYVRFMTAGNVEYEQLFDMNNDPWEMKNLAKDAKYQEIIKKMRDVMAEWERTVETSEPVKSNHSNIKKERPKDGAAARRKRAI